MPARDKKKMQRILGFSLKKLEDGAQIGIGDVAKVLRGIQDSIYNIGEYLFSEDDFRRCGKRNKHIEKRTTLYFKEAELGSFTATVEGEPQAPIWGQTLVEESIETFGKICQNLNEEENWDVAKKTMDELFKEPKQKSRIIGDIAEFWPGGDNNYELSISTPNYSSPKLERKRRPKILTLAKMNIESKSERTFGILSMTRGMPKKEFEIQGPDGKIKCRFTEDDIGKIKDYWLKPVEITGTCLVDEGGNIKEITELSDIQPLEKITLNRIFTKEGELKLSNPLDISLSFQDNQWMMENSILNIIVMGDTYDKTLVSFQEDFFFLYEKYYLGETEKMMGKALEIRKFIQILLEGGE